MQDHRKHGDEWLNEAIDAQRVALHALLASGCPLTSEEVLNCSRVLDSLLQIMQQQKANRVKDSE